MLVASHIKPWAVSSNSERLQVDNGLLLSATYDRLFDSGLITFDTSGRIFLSSLLSAENVARLHLVPQTSYSLILSPQMKMHLEYHNDRIFVK
ncbi:MAG: HNH endonuclease [Oscillospiraceae bacterium]|nr:HNH endonuclease [Oscillospiraceae bacterium]